MESSAQPDERARHVDGVGELWHLKMTYLQECWHRLYEASSSGDEVGTLSQLRAYLDRAGVASDVKGHMHEVEAFFTQIVQAHVLAAAVAYLGVDNIQAESPFHWPDIVDPAVVRRLLRGLVTSFLSQGQAAPPERTHPAPSLAAWLDARESANPAPTPNIETDGIRDYACNTPKSGKW